MTKCKLSFGALIVELEGLEDTEGLSEKALGLLSFLIKEQITYNENFGVEVEQDEVYPTSNSTNPTSLPLEVLRAYL